MKVEFDIGFKIGDKVKLKSQNTENVFFEIGAICGYFNIDTLSKDIFLRTEYLLLNKEHEYHCYAFGKDDMETI